MGGGASPQGLCDTDRAAVNLSHGVAREGSVAWWGRKTRGSLTNSCYALPPAIILAILGLAASPHTLSHMHSSVSQCVALSNQPCPLATVSLLKQRCLLLHRWTLLSVFIFSWTPFVPKCLMQVSRAVMDIYWVTWAGLARQRLYSLSVLCGHDHIRHAEVCSQYLLLCVLVRT